ncbi:MAG: glycosyltransferase family 25 protein [Pseudomonadota bacterium]
MTVPVLVVNRTGDRDRWVACQASADAQGIAVTRIAAIDAHAPDFDPAPHRDLLRTHFWGEPVIKPGALGCFLSHRLAWQRAASGTSPWTVICEDDASFKASLGPLIAVLETHPEADLVFANERMAAWCRHVGQRLQPLADILHALALEHGPRRIKGLKRTPGADCYALSRTGAAALLARTEAQGIVCGVDWAMVWNAAGPIDAAVSDAFPELATLSANLTPPAPLRALVVADALADQSGAPSVLKHSERRALATWVRVGA